jgi:sulfite exporter TauE/SafE
MVLSLVGGFVITSFTVSVFADFSPFAKSNGPGRSVVFRHFWMNIGRTLPYFLLLVLLPGLGALEFLQGCFLIAAAASVILLGFK